MNEIKRLQQLAGILTEIKVNKPKSLIFSKYNSWIFYIKDLPSLKLIYNKLNKEGFDLENIGDFEELDKYESHIQDEMMLLYNNGMYIKYSIFKPFISNDLLKKQTGPKLLNPQDLK